MARHWCYTHFDLLNEPKWVENEMSYMVYQREKAPTTGTEHFQGYVCFKKKRTLGWIKNNIDSTAHWAKCKGTPEQNKEYCTKDDTRVDGTSPVEYGFLPIYIDLT